MESVKDWVMDWDSHDNKWAKLCMIHGTSEVRARVQTKVQNYAIYSALFLSVSMTLMAAPPEVMFQIGENLTVGTEEWYLWQVTKRICILGFAMGTVSHMTCILLSLSITDALAECLRDSSVYQIFAAGKGRNVKICRIAFRVGCFSDYFATLAATMNYVTWVEAISIFFFFILLAQGIQRYYIGTIGTIGEITDTTEFTLPKACFKHTSEIGHDVYTLRGTADWKHLATEVSERGSRRPTSKKSWRTGNNLAVFS